MTDLTDRMRTCAAAIIDMVDPGHLACRDAADLLIEASNTLESYQPHPMPVDERGEPMEIIPPVVGTDRSIGTWVAPGDTLPVARPYRSPRACPQCDSRANKRVRRDGNRMMLECPVCGHRWEFKR